MQAQPAHTRAPGAGGPLGWDTKAVIRWLNGLGFGQYADAFTSHHITGATLPILSKEVSRQQSAPSLLLHPTLALLRAPAKGPRPDARGRFSSRS